MHWESRRQRLLGREGRQRCSVGCGVGGGGGRSREQGEAEITRKQRETESQVRSGRQEAEKKTLP